MGDVSDLVIQAIKGIILDVDSVHKDFAPRSIIEARDQGNQRGFSASRCADDGKRLSLFNAEGDIGDSLLLRLGIGKGYVLKLYRSNFACIALCALGNGCLSVKHLVNTLGRHLRCGKHHKHHDHHHKGHDHVGRIGAEYDDVTKHGNSTRNVG